MILESIGIANVKHIVSIKDEDSNSISFEDYKVNYRCDRDLLIIGVNPRLKKKITEILEKNEISLYLELQDDLYTILL